MLNFLRDSSASGAAPGAATVDGEAGAASGAGAALAESASADHYNERTEADRTGISVSIVPLHTAVAGRARLQVAGLRGAPELAKLIERGLTGFGGVHDVSVNHDKYRLYAFDDWTGRMAPGAREALERWLLDAPPRCAEFFAIAVEAGRVRSLQATFGAIAAVR